MLACVQGSVYTAGLLKRSPGVHGCREDHLKLVSVSIQHSRLSSCTNSNLRINGQALKPDFNTGKRNLSPATICICNGLQ